MGNFYSDYFFGNKDGQSSQVPQGNSGGGMYGGIPRRTPSLGGSSMSTFGQGVPAKRTFYSRNSMQEAEQMCIQAGYRPIGKLVNKHGQNIVFGRIIQQQAQQRSYN